MKSILTAALILSIASHATAQSVNIDFGHTNPNPTLAPTSAFPGAAGQPGHWMNVPTNLALVPIDGIDGLASGITLNRVTGNTSTFSVNNPNTTGDFEALLDDFHGFTSVTTVVYQFTGVDPGAYTLFTYAIAPDNASFRTVVNVSGSSSSNPQVIGGSMPINGFVPGVTHAVHDILVGPDTTITVTLTGSGSAGSVNGFQLRQGAVELNATINEPLAYQCACSPVAFVGTANGPGGITSYTLEYSPTSAGPWVPISSGTSPVVNAVLGLWDTTNIVQGNYLIRLRVNGIGGNSAVGVTSVYVDRQAPTASSSNITPGIVLGGEVPIQGTANDRCMISYNLEFSEQGKGDFDPVDPDHVNYPSTVINSTLGQWDTTKVPDGFYDLRLQATDLCSAQSAITVNVVVDNQPPSATITSPSTTFDNCGTVVINGSALDTNIDRWTLEYTSAASSTWVPLASGTSNITGLLAVWETTGLPRGAYTLRLTVVDRAADLVPGGLDGHTSTTLRTIRLGRGADINNDGIVNSADLSVLLGNFGATCF